MPHTLDPADWDAVRALGHRMVDDMTTWLSAIREQPAWRAMPDSARAALRESLPEDPQGLERAYQDFQSCVLPYAVGNTHPRFWGWVKGTGSAEGMLAGLLTDGLNLNAWRRGSKPNRNSNCWRPFRSTSCASDIAPPAQLMARRSTSSIARS